jgi:hypothetical protein
MIPTFVFGYPNGQETGEFLALDLGQEIYPELYCDFSHIVHQAAPTSESAL